MVFSILAGFSSGPWGSPDATWQGSWERSQKGLAAPGHRQGLREPLGCLHQLRRQRLVLWGAAHGPLDVPAP